MVDLQNRRKLASLYQRIGPWNQNISEVLSYEQTDPRNPSNFHRPVMSNISNQEKEILLFVSYFLRDISHQILTPCRLFNHKIGLWIFDHCFYVAETRKYTEIRPVFSLWCLQLWDLIESHVVKSVAGYNCGHFYEVVKRISSLFIGYWWSFLQFTRF